MWDKLIPKEYGFFDLFDRHAAATLDAARTLLAILDEFPNVEGRVQRITELEHECDSITHMTVDLLHRTFITPLDRDEIMKLISTMDDVIDLVDGAARRIVMYEVRSIPPKLRQLAEVLVRAMEQVVEAVGRLKGLKGKDVDRLREIYKEIHRLENEGDGLQRAGISELFRESADDPLNVIKLKGIYEVVEQATDMCEDVANIIEGITLDHS